ncbi:valine--tRNA ligase [Gammaproteobacteria bacterium SCGC AG-212-F23]|nr:valine--tRNA ligase [Gammaproteobacteria bacterium SCGC AG-212-F23]
MEKTYEPHQIEQSWYQTWENKHYFAPKQHGLPYCIMLPPPNVTGTLHMGHGFGCTLMDILIRYHRMLGENVLWQPGTDHAGIATQMVVEKRLMLEGKTRETLGREAFIEKIWEWKNQSGNAITQQLRRLGASLDWPRERFTMDESLCATVQKVFINLYREGLIYRGTRLVNWDPKLHTAISDLEVISNEEEGKLWHIRYPLADQEGYIVVATTRPETLLGDVAVAVHPDDERYQHLIGKQVQLPLTHRTVPIISDEYVDKAFGSGCVKITPAHDFNDYLVGERHQLKPINIFTRDAHLNKNTPQQYQGLERFAAREQIVKDLENSGLIEKIEKHISKIPRGEKSNAIIEPFLTEQWFMKMQPLAEPAIRAVENGEIRFIPDNWNKTYFQWLNNIEDWCISRQLWWGHRIPAWYDKKGKAYVGESEADVRAYYQLADTVQLTQDNDVLDTWFSSALWPFSTLGWPEHTQEFKTFYPGNVLVTGFDIIFFWVARMIMMGLKLTGKIPFREVFITGLIRDQDGQKMSKSKGNVIDPLDLIDGIDIDALVEKRIYGLMQPAKAKQIEAQTRKQYPEGFASHGTDALRFTFCALASYGREIRFDLGRLEGYRNFCNKLWNAARYVFMNVTEPQQGSLELSLPDRWILSRLQNTIADAHAALQQYRFDLFAHAIYEFTWNEFCDWYLELSKPILTSDKSSAAQQRGTRHTLITVLETLLRLLHPIMPFITEEIWQRAAPLADKKGDTIMLQAYPQVDPSLQNELIETELTWVKAIIIAIRTVRSEMNIAPGKPLAVLLHKGTESDKRRYQQYQSLIHALAKLESVAWLDLYAIPPESATALVGDLEILIPMAGLIDKDEESARLTREIAKLNKESERMETKLQNPQFVDKAPADVVTKERSRLAELKTTLTKLEQQLEKIAAL